MQQSFIYFKLLTMIELIHNKEQFLDDYLENNFYVIVRRVDKIDLYIFFYKRILCLPLTMTNTAN
jgi:hypothetical protein